MKQQRASNVNELVGTRLKKNRKQKLYQFYQKSYIYAVRIPLIQRYVMKIRKRLSSIHTYDELTIRKESMRITLLALGGLSFSVLLLSLIGNDLTFTFFVLLGAVVVNGTLIDNFVNKVSDRLLYQQTELIEDTRHQYNQHKMVDEAILGAAEVSKYEISTHARKIHETITSTKPEEKLQAYYDVAPNRFLKVFAGISFLVKEYGDKNLNDKGSMYLSTLDRLKGEILEEILYRKKLRYYLNSLSIMAIVPVFFLKPIEIWANKMFPSMDEFYTSKLGYIIKIIIFMVILLSYVLLKKIQDNEDENFPHPSKHRLLKRLYKKRPIKIVIDKLVPDQHTKKYFDLDKLLKDTNQSLTMESFFLQRIISFLVVMLISISLFMYMHTITINHTFTSYSLFRDTMTIGKMSPEEEKKLGEVNEFDRSIIVQLKGVRENVKDDVAVLVNRDLGKGSDSEEIIQTTNRITEKIVSINKEYFKWWELLLSIGMGVLAYNVPIWLLQFQRRMREMQMKIEVNQMHTIIGMLSEFERVSVETILEWMERFSFIFRTPLKKCLLNFESGSMEALQELVIEAPFPSFVRTIERLQNALERIPVKEAFADLETDRNYYLEDRKQENEKIINKKANWGRMLGFAPMNAVVFLYLVFPFIYVSIISSSAVYEQLNKTI